MAIEHLDHPDPRTLEEQVASVVRRIATAGDVLLFLPGAAEAGATPGRN